MSGLKIQTGSAVYINGKPGKILKRKSAALVLVQFDDEETALVHVNNLAAPPPDTPVTIRSGDSLSPAHHQIALRFMERLLPFANQRRIPKAIMVDLEKELGVHRTTIQRMLKRFRDLETLVAFAPPNRPGGRGKSRLSEPVEAIVQTLIESEYLSRKKIRVQHLYELVVEACATAGVKPPDRKTIYRRIDSIHEHIRVKKREGNAAIRDKFELQRGNFPDATYVLAVIQIDHTEVDVFVVDEFTRVSIGRPTITVAIDVYTGMVTGFYLAVQAPSTDMVGACLYRSMMPKAEWLADLGINAEWPIHGKFDTVHSDNAAELRSASLSTTYMELQINSTFRPVGKPRYGGHIENFFNWLAEHVRKLPGATGPNRDEKTDLNAEKTASFTLRELEKEIAELICADFHAKPHSGGLSRMGYLELAIRREKYVAEKFQWVPATREERDDLRIRFMPMFLVTVQQYGIQLDRFTYSDTILRSWVRQRNPKRPDGKFVVRRDPSEFNVIYFLDPNLDRYFPVPFANPANPRVSEPEVRDAVQKLNVLRKEITQNAIIDAVRATRENVEQARKKTIKAKRLLRRAAAAKQKPLDLRPLKPIRPMTTVVVDNDQDIEQFETEEF